MTILDSWRRKSRGKVRCSLCGTTISKGVEYLVQKTVDAGTLWEDKTCPECEVALALYWRRNQDYYFSWDDFENAHVEEDFYEELQHPSPDLTVRDAQVMCAYLARSGTEEYR